VGLPRRRACAAFSSWGSSWCRTIARGCEPSFEAPGVRVAGRLNDALRSSTGLSHRRNSAVCGCGVLQRCSCLSPAIQRR
jgi:hypothetical protein